MLTRWLARKAWNWLGAYMCRSSIKSNSEEWNTLLKAREILLRASEDEK